MLYTNIKFWDSADPTNKTEINVTDYSDKEIEILANHQREFMHRDEMKFIKGYLKNCSWCGAFISLEPIEHSSGICKTCSDKQLKLVGR